MYYNKLMFKCQTIDKDNNKNRKDDKENERDMAENSRNCNGMYAVYRMWGNDRGG